MTQQTKYCKGCEKHLPIEKFGFKSIKRGQRECRCKYCLSEQRKLHSPIYVAKGYSAVKEANKLRSKIKTL